MKIKLELQHSRTMAKSFYEIWGIDAATVCRAAATSKEDLERLVNSIIRTKLPTEMRNFGVVSWDFGVDNDHSGAASINERMLAPIEEVARLVG